MKRVSLSCGKKTPAASAGGNSSSGKKFSSSADDFVPLGKGASSSVNTSSWGSGQKPAPMSAGTDVASVEDPTPAGAAAAAAAK